MTGGKLTHWYHSYVAVSLLELKTLCHDPCLTPLRVALTELAVVLLFILIL